MAISVPTFIQLSMMLAIIDDIDSAVSTLTTDRAVHTEQQLACYWYSISITPCFSHVEEFRSQVTRTERS